MSGFTVESYNFYSIAHGLFPCADLLWDITGLKETKGEQKEGGRDPLVSFPTDPVWFIQEPPLRDFSGEPMATFGEEIKLNGTNGSSHHSQ